MANTLKFGNGQWATGNGTALAYNDENSNFKPLLFDFTRASSGTTVNQSGLIETVGSGIPRIDFLGNTKGALLLEPSRTNSITYSEDFSQWSIDGQASIVSNSIVSPDGNLNATKLIAGSTLGRQAIKLNNTSTGDLAISVFAKKGEYSVLQFSDGRNPSSFVNFDLQNNLVGSSFEMVGQITKLTNDWYKCTATYNESLDMNGFRLSIAENINQTRLVEFSGNNSDGVYIFGAQVEAGSYATSYIPTSGSAVTRVADNPFQREDLASKNLIGSTELTWFYDCILFYKEAGTSVAPRIESSTNNQIFIGINVPATNSTDLRIRHKDGTTAANTSSFPFTNGGRFKVAIKISGTTGSAYINGTNVGTFTTVAAINYNQYNNAINNPNNINDMRVYNTALTDQELIALTT